LGDPEEGSAPLKAAPEQKRALSPTEQERALSLTEQERALSLTEQKWALSLTEQEWALSLTKQEWALSLTEQERALSPPDPVAAAPKERSQGPGDRTPGLLVNGPHAPAMGTPQGRREANKS
jgi:hypothetical protein